MKKENLRHKSKALVSVLHKNRTTTVVAVIVLAIVLIGSVVVFNTLFSEERVLALKVGEREVTQDDFDEYVRLGEQIGLEKHQVRDIVIEYEKNLAMVDEYNISIPEEYVDYIGRSSGVSSEAAANVRMSGSEQAQLDEVMAAYREVADESSELPVPADVQESQKTQAPSTSQGYSQDNKLTRAIGYNTVFDLRLSQFAYDGYGVFVYDFANNGVGSGGEAAGSAKKVAKEYRDKIKRKELSPSEAMKEVRAYGAARGHNSFSSVTFIIDTDAPDSSDTAASVRSTAFVLKSLKEQSKEVGLSEVIETDADGAFFMYVSFKQRQQDNIQTDVAQAKESTRVVIYDK